MPLLGWVGARTRMEARVDLPLPLVPQISTTTHFRLSFRLQAQRQAGPAH